MRTLVALIDTGHEIETNGVVLRSQCKPDLITLEKLLPPDRSQLFRASWDGNTVRFDKVPEAGPINVVSVHGATEDPAIATAARVNSLSAAKLKTRAVELGVEVPTGASMVTMRELVIKAELEQMAKASREE